jgi:hypothetical protein
MKDELIKQKTKNKKEVGRSKKSIFKAVLCKAR